EWLARLSGPGLPALGPLGLLPVGRRLRLPRPAPGCRRSRLRAARAHARADPPPRGAPVRRGRRPSLVAPAERPGHAHALLRRSPLAALRHRLLCPDDRRRERAG